MKKDNKSILGYKQAPGCKVWEVLPTLSLDKVEQATKPEANGLKDGSRNYPAASCGELAETETHVLYQAEEYLAGVNDIATKEMTDIGRQIGDCTMNKEDAFADLEASADKEFQHYILQAQPELQKMRVEERRQLRDFKLFKAKNGLERLASYPESRWFHIALVAVATLAECCANTYFFAAGSELGLLGGFFQAFLISAGNVGVSFLIGRLALSNLHHINRLRVTAGVIGFSAWIVGICAYHLLVAHYRDMLAINHGQVISSAMDSFASAPFHLESLDSVLVGVIGILISIFALIEGYRFDDTYPEYGKEDRKYRQKQRAYEAKEGEVRNRMADSIRDAEKRVNERLNAYEEKDAKMADLLSGATSVVDHFDNIYNQVDDIISAVVSKYRNANRKIRTDADPISFSTIPQARRVLEIENFHNQLDEFRANKDASTILLQKIREHAAKVEATLTDRTGAMLKNIEKLTEEVSNRADKEISYLNKEV